MTTILTPQIWGLCLMCTACGLIYGTATALNSETRVAGFVLLVVGMAAFYGSAIFA